MPAMVLRKEYFYHRGNSPHPSSYSQEVDMSYERETDQNLIFLRTLYSLELKRPSFT